MATPVTKTIKTTGGDYTTLAAAVAGEQQDLVANNIQLTFEYYELDTLEVLASTLDVTGYTTDSTRYIKITVPVSDYHGGVTGVGARLQIPSDWRMFKLSEEYTEVERLCVQRTGGADGAGGVGAFEFAAIHGKAEQCLADGSAVSFYHGFVYIGGPAVATKIGNCIAIGKSGGTKGEGFGGGGSTWQTGYVYNCTSINHNIGFRSDNNTIIHYKNCLSSGAATSDFHKGTKAGITFDYCASSDATADDTGGTGNRINQTFTFVDAANDDYHLDSADAGAIGYGTDLSSDPDYPFSDDVDGEARSAPWDIGFDQYAATGSSAALTGTATSSITESDIVTGGKTIILTLTGDTWVAAGAAFDAQRQNVIDGLDSAQTEGTGWDAEVKANEVVGAVVRTSDTVVTITLTASAAYDVTAQETITATIPATALVTSESAVVAVPTFTVDFATGATTISAQLEQISLQSLLSNSQLNKTVTASFATLSQTTSPVIVTLSKSISTLSENIDVIPQLSSIALSKFILPSTESLSVSTLSAATSLSTTVHATTAQITLSELVSSISRTKSISASASYIELTTNPSVAEVSRVIDATTHSVDLSSNSCSILLSSDIPSNLESILLSHLGSQVALNSEIDSLIESVTLSTNGVTIVLDTNVTATIPSAILSAHSVIVTKGIVVPNTAGLAFDSLSRKLHLSGRSRKFHFSGNDTLSLTFK